MKIGFSQISRPTPKVLLRIKDAIIGLMPFIGATISQIPPEDLSDRTKIYLGIISGGIVAIYTFLIKVIGVDEPDQS